MSNTSPVDSTYTLNNAHYSGGISNVVGVYATLQQTGSSATIAGPGGVTAIPPVKTYGGTDSLLVTIPVYGGLPVNIRSFGGADIAQYGTLKSSYASADTCNSWATSF